MRLMLKDLLLFVPGAPGSGDIANHTTLALVKCSMLQNRISTKMCVVQLTVSAKAFCFVRGFAQIETIALPLMEQQYWLCPSLSTI